MSHADGQVANVSSWIGLGSAYALHPRVATRPVVDLACVLPWC